MPSPEIIAKNFRELDFHDDTFVDMRIVPSQYPEDGAKSIVEIHLHHGSENERRRIQFFGCANLSVAMDFDVLAQNFPPNTSRLDAHVDANRMRDLMEAQKCDWDVNYAHRVAPPLAKKLASYR